MTMKVVSEGQPLMAEPYARVYLANGKEVLCFREPDLDRPPSATRDAARLALWLAQQPSDRRRWWHDALAMGAGGMLLAGGYRGRFEIRFHDGSTIFSSVAIYIARTRRRG